MPECCTVGATGRVAREHSAGPPEVSGTRVWYTSVTQTRWDSPEFEGAPCDRRLGVMTACGERVSRNVRQLSVNKTVDRRRVDMPPLDAGRHPSHGAECVTGGEGVVLMFRPGSGERRPPRGGPMRASQ